MSFFENTRKPVGFGGKIMVALLNHNVFAYIRQVAYLFFDFFRVDILS